MTSRNFYHLKVHLYQSSMWKPGLELGAQGFQTREAGPPALASHCDGSGWAGLMQLRAFELGQDITRSDGLADCTPNLQSDPGLIAMIGAFSPLWAMANVMMFTTTNNQAKPAITTGICAKVHKPGQVGPITCRRYSMEGWSYLTWL